jgi:hypothetical protein
VTPPDEAERRLRRVAQLRNLILEMRRALRSRHARGEVPWGLSTDLRSDPEYWDSSEPDRDVELSNRGPDPTRD